MSHPFTIRCADQDDIIPIHRFLCLVAQPVLMAPIDAEDSIAGVADVIGGNAYALVAEINGEIVGSLGLVTPVWWYNRKVPFFTDRWFFIYPQLAHLGVGAGLQAEAHATAARAGADLVINGKMVRRSRASGPGIVYTSPTVLRPGEAATPS
jgi:hypothetical protein